MQHCSDFLFLDDDGSDVVVPLAAGGCSEGMVVNSVDEQSLIDFKCTYFAVMLTTGNVQANARSRGLYNFSYTCIIRSQEFLQAGWAFKISNWKTGGGGIVVRSHHLINFLVN